jgi:hypothetical protein
MKRLSGLTQHFALLLASFLAITPIPAVAQNTQQLAFAGLSAIAGKGQFNSIQIDSAGNLYLLLDQKDGVRILKTDPGATQVYAQVQLGAAGDTGIAMALDPAGNVYVTGTTTSGALSATSGVAFPACVDSSTNSFVARFDSTLNPVFVTYAGSGRMAATAIAATSDAVLITGSIFAATLPVTASAIIQTPAPGSNGNGFVECFNSSGSALIYSTYLSGYGGDTAPAAIAADASGNAYIAGYTTSSGYPTVAAVVPAIIGTASGFLTKLSAAGDAIAFSTFIPGEGMTSIAMDRSSQNLLLSGSIALGGFPVTSVTSPLVATTYQVAIRMPLDGSTVLASTLLAPGTTSVIASAANGMAWATQPLSMPLLPLPAISSIGNTAAFRITMQGTIDQSLRMGGAGPDFTPTVPVTIASIASDASGQPIFAGNAAPTTSASLLATKTFDLPLSNSPTAALPSTVRDAMLPVGTNCGSLCTGSAAYLSKLSLTAGASLALSIDSAPNVTLRNLGSLAATNLQITATGFSLTHNCPTQLGAGAECNIALNGTGPGTLTATALNAVTQSATLSATTKTAVPIVLSPAEIDFGIVTGRGITRTVTVSNLGSTPQPVPFYPFAANISSANAFTLSTDCPSSTLSTAIQPGTSCHILFAANLPSSLAFAIPTSSSWTIGTSTITATAYLDPSPLNLSATRIDFGTQYSTSGSLRLPRYLYLSNNSSSPIQHAQVALPSTSVFVVADRCPSVLEPHTVCQLRIDYASPGVSSDSVTVTLDQGLSALIAGQTITQPGTGGTSTNPGLSVTPSSLNFPNPVLVTTTPSTSQTVTISNTGSQSFPLLLTLNGDFTQSTSCPTLLAGGATCSVVITFAPSQPGTRQGLLTVTSGSGTTPVYVSFSGTGTAILATNNGTLDLGSTIIGQPVVLWTKITQSLSQLTASSSGDFGVVLVEDIGYGHGQPASSSFTPVATGSCANCWLGIQFLPSTVGSAVGSLSLSSSASGNPYTLSLTGNALPLSGLVLTPVQQDFGPVAVRSVSAPSLVSLTNLTTTTATISAPILSGDFLLSSAPTGGAACVVGISLAPAASCFLQVIYAPAATGPAAGTLTLSSGTATATATLTGYGSADNGLSLNPTALVFRNVPGITASQQVISLTNTGTYNLQIAPPTSGLSAFQSTSTCGTLIPGATCTITVTYTPASATSAGVLTLPVTSSAAGNPVTTYTVPLTGAYTSEDAGLQIIPNQTIYGPATTSRLGITRQFTINNLTAKAVTLRLSMPRQFVLAEPPCAALAPYGSCNFSVAFLPLTNSDITGTLFAQATPTDASAALNALGYVEGFGIGSGKLAITGAISPGGLVSFGQVASGQTATRTLTLTNTGSTAITVRRIISEWPFLATTTCGTPLSPAASCTVSLTYSPLNQIASGASPAPFSTDAGTLAIESDAISSPDFIDLTGTVTPVSTSSPSNTAPLLSYSVSQGSLAFPATSGGNASSPQTVTLANTGTTILHVSGLITTPDFTLGSSCNILVPGASCPISVTFTPQASSAQTSSSVVSALEISSDAGTPLNFVSLYGTAMPSTLVLSPVALDFGAVLVGSSATLPITATNGSTSPAVFAGITATGDYAVSHSSCPAAGAQLAPSAICTLQITFSPGQAGARTGAVSIATSLTNFPLVVNLTGMGAQSHLQTTPAALSFPATIVGSPSKLTLSIANTGNAPVSGITLTSTGDYTITTPCSSTILAAGASCAVTLTFTPSTPGIRTGSLTITSSDPNSPLSIPITGSALAPGAFSLSVDGASSSAATVTSGQPASYKLALTPLNGYTGAVVLNCTPVNPGQYASCSLLPSNVTIGAASAASVATINTVTSVAAAQNRSQSTFGESALCLLPLGVLFFRRTRSALALALISATTLFATGCGSGGAIVTNNSDPNLRYTPPGIYQYQVTATSTTGVPVSQTVTLNLTVTSR